MQLEYQKVLIRAIVVEREDDQVVGERLTREVVLYTPEQVAAYVPKLRAEIDEENARLSLESVGSTDAAPEV